MLGTNLHARPSNGTRWTNSLSGMTKAYGASNQPLVRLDMRIATYAASPGVYTADDLSQAVDGLVAQGCRVLLLVAYGPSSASTAWRDLDNTGADAIAWSAYHTKYTGSSGKFLAVPPRGAANVRWQAVADAYNDAIALCRARITTAGKDPDVWLEIETGNEPAYGAVNASGYASYPEKFSDFYAWMRPRLVTGGCKVWGPAHITSPAVYRGQPLQGDEFVYPFYKSNPTTPNVDFMVKECQADIAGDATFGAALAMNYGHAIHVYWHGGGQNTPANGQFHLGRGLFKRRVVQVARAMEYALRTRISSKPVAITEWGVCPNALGMPNGTLAYSEWGRLLNYAEMGKALGDTEKALVATGAFEHVVQYCWDSTVAGDDDGSADTTNQSLVPYAHVTSGGNWRASIQTYASAGHATTVAEADSPGGSFVRAAGEVAEA